LEFSGKEQLSFSVSAEETSIDNTSLALIQHRQSLNEILIKQTRAEYMPTLDFKINVLWNVQSNDLSFFSDRAFGNNISTLGLKMDIPLYYGDEKKKKIQKLYIEQQMLELQKEKLLEGHKLQNENAVENLKFKKERFYHQQKVSQLKSRYLEKAENRFEKGLLSIKDLLDARSELLEAQITEAELWFDVKLAELDYLKWNNQIYNKLD
jgi:outer membrane protein TolC